MLLPTIHSTHHDHLKFCFSYQATPLTERKSKGRGNKIMEGTVVKAKIGELEEKVRAGNSRKTKKEFTGVVQGISGSRRLLVRQPYARDAPTDNTLNSP